VKPTALHPHTTGVRRLLNEAVRVTENRAALWRVELDDAHFYGLHDFDKALRDVPPASRELSCWLTRPK
jgi:hypothetical protein